MLININGSTTRARAEFCDLTALCEGAKVQIETVSGTRHEGTIIAVIGATDRPEVITLKHSMGGHTYTSIFVRAIAAVIR